MQSTNKSNSQSSKQKEYVYVLDTRKFRGKDGYNYYYKNYKGVWDYIFDDYKKKDNLVAVQFDKNNAVEMRVVELLIHLVLWRPNVVFNVPIERKDFHVIDPLSKDRIVSIMNTIIKRFISEVGNVTPLFAESISYIIENFGKLSEGYSSIACNTISLYDIIQFKNRNKDFANLLNTTLDDSKSVKELEDQIKASKKKLLKTIIDDKKNNFYPYVQAGRISDSQLTQMLVAVGPRPDIDKTVLPKPIVRGYIHGLKDIAEYYVESVTARDALLTKYNNVPLSGYLSRKMNILCLGTELDYTKEDCGTKYYLNYEVKSENHLKSIVGKYMIMPDGKLKEVLISDKQLIDTTVKLRSHIMCAHHESGKVCPTCYGAGSKMLIGTRIGGLPAIKVANPMSNKSMGAKHQQGTNSVEITNEYINYYFQNDGTNLFIRKEFLDSKKLYIVIDKDDLEEILYSDIDVEDTSVNMSFPLNSITIRDGDQNFVIENEGLMLTLSDQVISDRTIFVDDENDTDKVLIPVRKLDSEVPVFSMILTTEEISKYLKMFISVTDRNSIQKFSNVDQLIGELVSITLDSGIFVKLTHFETILYNMIRDKDNIVDRPDFSKEDAKYVLLKISQAIEKKDVYTALIFQGIKRQFKDITTYHKTGKGVYDPFFRVTPVYTQEQMLENQANADIETAMELI